MIWLLLYLLFGCLICHRAGTDPREYPQEAALIICGWLPLLAWFAWMCKRGRV